MTISEEKPLGKYKKETRVEESCSFHMEGNKLQTILVYANYKLQNQASSSMCIALIIVYTSVLGIWRKICMKTPFALYLSRARC